MIDELKHHGIKGMRWGVRRTPEQLGHEKNGSQSGGKSGSPTQNSEDQKKRTQTMSDEELRSRINRLNMEEQYANLVARQKQRDTSFVQNLLMNAGKQLATQSLNTIISKAINKAGDKIFAEKKKSFNITDYKDMDVSKMDLDTVRLVAEYYTKANVIERSRSRG